MTCKRKGCNKQVHAKGLCSRHYHQYYRKMNPNVDKIYEKTVDGYLMRMYRNMLSRVSGVDKNKAHLYEGKFILNKYVFYKWAKNHPTFLELFATYKANNCVRRLAPSVDRINPDKGYRISNMEWVTQSENSRRATITRKRLE